MLLRRAKGQLVFECDECGVTHYSGEHADFTAFLVEIKDEGWSIRKDEDGEWMHICPDCIAEIR